MTSIEFDSCKTGFLSTLELSRNLEKFGSPAEKRLEQLADLSTAASRLTPFSAQVLLPEHSDLSEGMFVGRDFYNQLVNPDKVPGVKFPQGYEVFRTFTRQILEKREEKKAKLAPPAPSKSKAKTRSQSKTKDAAAEDSDSESVIVTTGPGNRANDAASDQMLVDEDAAAKASALHFKKKSAASETSSSTGKSKKGSAKRARTDSNPFHEEAFLTASAAAFYTSHAAVPVLIDEVTSIAQQDSDFLENRLAMNKRLYYINVELSCLLEQFRSGLLRRNQLIEEGQFLMQTIQKLEGNSSAGLDSMVP
ncbi:hypothetical protein FB451DRAFT_1360322 [Mycena latifolia]|nr:hypothetical protein FB451DRAFT_1568411 [Mycena latifolia]KAJ7466129.1 hypothetical protein FB451DRAFT_1369838 [Mycena latifolia]KAJ7495631.1 hypothetical protein FB451DRAFT_1360322 [Mycena latifolia]